MKDYEKYYTEKLYPFQDGVLKIVKECDTPFYLTGGTALSRFYYNHRYSDDLDLFVNNDGNFNTYFSTILAEFEKYEKENKLKINRTSSRKEFDFAQVFLSIPENEDIVLKIDFVNDWCKDYLNPEYGTTIDLKQGT